MLALAFGLAGFVAGASLFAGAPADSALRPPPTASAIAAVAAANGRDGIATHWVSRFSSVPDAAGVFAGREVVEDEPAPTF